MAATGSRTRLGMVSVVVVVLVLVDWSAWSGSVVVAEEGDGVGYSDVARDSAHYGSISLLAADGVFEGTDCGEGRFCPTEGVSRRTFAVWLVRALEGTVPAIPREALSRFGDVSADAWEAPYIVRLADLGVTVGCASEPPRFCPDRSVSRAQMASFLVRAFTIPQAPGGGFVDVGADDTHADAIDRVASIGVTRGCSTDPLRYCPQAATTRAQMASFLVRAMRWRESVPTGPVGEIPDVPSDVSVVLEDDEKMMRVSWLGTGDGVDHFAVQWRRGYEEFDAVRQRIAYPTELTSDSTRSVLTLATVVDACLLRVVAVNDAGSAASDEVFVPTWECRLMRTMEEGVINVYGGEHPWLEVAWAHMNQPGFTISFDPTLGPAAAAASVSPRRLWSSTESLSYTEIYKMTFKYRWFADPAYILDSYKTIVHELAHVYTLTNNLAVRPGPLGLAHLYFERLGAATGEDRCTGEELYADAIVALVIPDSRLSYWYSCMHPEGIPNEESMKVIRQAFDGQIPDWFYENFGLEDGSLDLEMIWEEVKGMRERFLRTTVVYQLHDEFGGYCSPAQAYRSAFGASEEVKNPWRDGGCEQEEDPEPLPHQ